MDERILDLYDRATGHSGYQLVQQVQRPWVDGARGASGCSARGQGWIDGELAVLRDVRDGCTLGGCCAYSGGRVEETTGASGTFEGRLLLVLDVYGLAQGDVANWTGPAPVNAVVRGLLKVLEVLFAEGDEQQLFGRRDSRALSRPAQGVQAPGEESDLRSAGVEGEGHVGRNVEVTEFDLPVVTGQGSQQGGEKGAG